MTKQSLTPSQQLWPTEVKIVCAQDTGLVPNGWTVESDDVESAIDLAKLDFTYSPCGEDEDYIFGDEMLKRAKAAKALGSLGFAKLVLDAQAEGRDIIPTYLPGMNHIILPRTVLRDLQGYLCVPDLYIGRRDLSASYIWTRGVRWYQNFRRLEIPIFASCVVTRVRE